MLKKLYQFLSPKYQNVFLEYKVNTSPRYGYGKKPHQKLLTILQEQEAKYTELIDLFLKNTTQIQAIQTCDQENSSTAPCWNNGFFPGLDIFMLYSFIKHLHPKRYIEVGSGNSTKVVAKAIKDNNLSTRITSIDPYPRAEIDSLVDTIVRKPFEELSYEDLLSLEANDILFIDNSHRVLPNSDATAFFLDVLPYLKTGVVVHIHDIYLPYDYPDFMCERFYSEQYMLAAFLLANPEKYQVLMPNYYVSEMKQLSSKMTAFWDHPNLANVERHGGSFWLQIG
jgi:hypothetical protein